MAVQLATVTGTFPAGAAAFPTFTPSQAVNLDGGPELLGAQAVKAQIANGILLAADGVSALQLPRTDQGTPLGPTGFWYWVASGLPGVPSFGFTLVADSDITDLIGSPFSGAAAVTSVNTQTGAVVLAAADVGAVAKAGDVMDGRLAPKVIALAQAAGAVAVDASLGNVYTLTLTAGGWTISSPSNAADGDVIRFRLTQDATGSRTVTWDTAYDFGATGAPVLTVTAAKTDFLAFEYDAALSKWCCLGSGLGY